MIRERSLSELHEVLFPSLLDSGFLFQLFLTQGEGLVYVSARANDYLEGYGLREDRREAEALAGLEVLERYASTKPRGRPAPVRGSYRDLRERALDPRSLLLHEDPEAGDDQGKIAIFDESAPINWVLGHSLTRREPVLVPECAVYYGLGGPERFVYETSSGCAIGSTIEEAGLAAIYELLERDAFLRLWSGMTTARRVPGAEGVVAEQLGRYHRSTRLQYLVSTYVLEAPVPVAMVIGTTAGHCEDLDVLPPTPGLVVGLGAGPTWESSAQQATTEAFGAAQRVITEDERQQAAILVRDPKQVRRQEDHVLRNCASQHERAGLDGRDESGFAADVNAFMERLPWQPSRLDVASGPATVYALANLLGREVILVDTTPPDVARMGLVTVRAIVPGLLPLTFGFHNARGAAPNHPFS